MKYSALLFLVSFLWSTSLDGQQINLYFGLELNQTRFRQHAPTVLVPFDNPHRPGLGMTTFFTFQYYLSEQISLQLSPRIGFYNTKSDVTNDYQLNVFGGTFTIAYHVKKIALHGGMEYNRLHRLYGTNTRGGKNDWTWFAHCRNLFGPTASLGYKINPEFQIHVRTTFFLKDFYSSGALDHNGNIVGPVEITPYNFSIGADINLTEVINHRNVKY